ncbi:uncharacterized protein [Rutidosis leptorrhynchoides]|uniref:uncharacterized protein n=1 Tax=Rutidosis leptorrhynchoides TaxID=125765 RepID=UPI003A99DADB
MSKMIDDRLLQSYVSASETMNNNLVPKSLGIFAWRIKKKRIPVRVKLDKRGLDLNTIRCPVCDDSLETVEHSMIFCKVARDTWDRVYKWWGLGNFNTFSVDEILNGDGINISSKDRKIWQAVEWVCGYLLWKNRNHKVFRNKDWTSAMIFNEVQIKSYEWISKRLKSKLIEWHQWLVNPSSYCCSSSPRTGVG